MASDPPPTAGSAHQSHEEFDLERRLAAVIDLQLLDRIGDPVLTALTRLASYVTGARSAAVHIFDAHYQRRIAAVGVPLVDVPENDTLCRIVVGSGTRLVVRDASVEERFSFASATRDAVDPLRFYAGLPLKVSGDVTVGALCVFDSTPRQLTDEQVARLEDIAEVARTHLELVRIASTLGRAATLDPLTGAVNRVMFDDRLAQALARRRRRGTPVLIAVIDLDDFKRLNDSFGHARGDAALQWVVSRLREVVRDEDTIGRLGGDEFGLIAEGSHGDFQALVRRVMEVPKGFEPAFTLSVGTALVDDDDDVESALARADEAMYAAKRARKT